MGADFASAWVERPLEDCMEAIIDYRGKTPEKKAFGIPLVTAKLVKNGRIERPQEFIAPEDYDAWMRRGLPRARDVVMTTEAPLGEIGQLDGAKVALAQRIITLRGKPDLLDNDYLKYAMQSAYVQDQLRARASGTTVLGIKQSELRRVMLRFPRLPQQRAIAHILGTLDDKIELNRRMNETLEAVARALFKSWFVDFDPVRAKAEGRAPLGMDAETAKLFPSEYDTSEIPKGWRSARLSDVAALNPESWIRSTFPNSIVYVDLSGTKRGRIESTSTFSWTDAPSRAQRVLRPNDTIVGTVRPGNESYALISEDGLTGSTGFAVLRPTRPEYVAFTYLAATARENIEALAHFGRRTSPASFPRLRDAPRTRGLHSFSVR